MKKYIDEIIKFIKNEKNDIALSFILGVAIFATYIALSYSYTYSMNIKNDLADNLIRFHVLANSDSEEDQALKIYVKDSILKRYREDLLENETREEAIEFFESHKEEIEDYAQMLVKLKGYSYDVNCELALSDFPTKSYNDITLPKGEYLAFRVLIGDHEGKNFWCVLYPPLCYVDAVDKETFDNSKTMLADSISEDEFILISETDKPVIKVKFKIVEMWNNHLSDS